MPNILDDIITAKRPELALQKAEVPLAELERRAAGQPAPLDLAGALRGKEVSLIAEVKKASPSRGLLCPDFDPVRLAETYAENGAAAISVLTDPRFQGELDHIVQIKDAGVTHGTPVLRKDFIFDHYQLYEARAAGADALLLIVAVLSPAQLKELHDETLRLGMQCLVEVHDEGELAVALEAGAQIVGVNNRDLTTFSTDLAVSYRLSPQIPRDKVIVSESGISSVDHLKQLAQVSAHAVLVGEALVTSSDVGGKVRELAGRPLATNRPQIGHDQG